MADRCLCTAGAGGIHPLPMRVSSPRPVPDRNCAPMGPGIISNTGAGVWRKDPGACWMHETYGWTFVMGKSSDNPCNHDHNVDKLSEWCLTATRSMLAASRSFRTQQPVMRSAGRITEVPTIGRMQVRVLLETIPRTTSGSINRTLVIWHGHLLQSLSEARTFEMA